MVVEAFGQFDHDERHADKAEDDDEVIFGGPDKREDGS